MFTGEPIRAQLHGLYNPSSNPKTGPGQQLALIPDQEDAILAVKDGGDRSVCGDCVLRRGAVIEDKRLCYVNLMYVNGQGKADYPAAQPEDVTTFGLLRLGSYGSPAAAPYEISERLVRNHPGRRKTTGYWQEWADPQFEAFGELCMASVVTHEQAEHAWDLGLRTFRVLGEGEEPLKNEIMCPHVTHKLTCLECGLCNGRASSETKSIANPVHGNGKRSFSLVQSFVRNSLTADLSRAG